MVIDLIMAPFLKLSPLASITVISFILSIFITIAYKFMTNQSVMKQLKDEMKESQKQAKELKHEPQKAMAAQKKAMETNMKYMMQSFKPMIITFIPLILVFGWLNAHYGVEPIKPGEYFKVTIEFGEAANNEVELIEQEGIEITGSSKKQISSGKAEWELKGKEGEYLLEFRHGSTTYTKEVIISAAQEYANPTKKITGSAAKEIKTSQKKLVLFSVFGWSIG